MKRLVLFSLIMLFAGCSSTAYQYILSRGEASDAFVILVHGLRGKSDDFLKMEKALLAEGFNVCRVAYPSTEYTIEVLADSASGHAILRCEQAGSDTLHFVAHSMGSILVRYYLQEHDVPQLGRVVLISPPNHGTPLIDKFKGSKLFRNYNGPAGMQLSAADDAFVQSLEKPDYPVGVIMSTKSINPIESAVIPGEDDGRLSIESAKLDGMADFVLVRSNHHVSMKKEETIKQVLNFLKNGQFEKE